MSSESRVLRPFEVADRLSGALRRARFSYGTLRCGADERVVVEDGSFGLRAPALEWSSGDEFDDFKRDLVQGAQETGVDKSLLCLAVTARSSYPKICELIWCHSLDDLDGLDQRVQLAARPDGTRWRAFCTETHGAVVDAYVARRRAGRPSPGRPSRMSAWLAHVSFRIGCESDSELFKPQPLNDQSRKDLGLPAKTMRFIEIDSGESVTTPLSESNIPTFWVDEQLLTDLDARATSSVAQQIQRQLAVDFITCVIFEYAMLSSDEASGLHDEVKDSLIGRIVRFLSPGASDDVRDDVLRTCWKDPRRAAARAEHAVDVRAVARKSLEQ